MTDHGIFGFMRPENFFVCTILFGALAGFFGGSGYTISSFFNPPLIVMNIMLLEPLLSQLIAC